MKARKSVAEFMQRSGFDGFEKWLKQKPFLEVGTIVRAGKRIVDDGRVVARRGSLGVVIANYRHASGPTFLWESGRVDDTHQEDFAVEPRCTPGWLRANAGFKGAFRGLPVERIGALVQSAEKRLEK